MAQPPLSRWALKVHLCGLCTSLSCSRALIAVGTSTGGIYPGWSAARTGSDHWPPSSHHCGGSFVHRPTPQGRTYFSRTLVPTESVSWVCHLWKWLSGSALKWSVAVHWVRRLWGLPRSTGQGRPSLCSVWGHPNKLQSNLQLAATCVGLGGAQASPSCEPRPAVLLLVLGLGPLSNRHGVH